MPRRTSGNERQSSTDALVDGAGAKAAGESTTSAVEGAATGTGSAGAADLAPGQVVGRRYRLDEERGRGGMGVVWAATHLVTRRRVAIKFLKGPANLSTELRRRFLREARAASAVNHPNVVEVLDVFELEDETPVMVMELLTGQTLRDKLAREKTLSLEETATILLPVVGAVGAAHALGIVHRDLKPENIFIAQGLGQPDQVKVLDFGIAKLLSPEAEGAESEVVTDTGSMLGTPCYMAPEQTLGEKTIDHRADIWTLGVIVYECLAGTRPVEGVGIGQVVMKLATRGIVPLGQIAPALPVEASALVMRMLERERAERPQDLREVRDLLARYALATPLPLAHTEAAPRLPAVSARQAVTPGPPVDSQAPQAVPHPSRRRSGRSFLVAVAAGATLVGAVAGWRWIVPASRPSPSSPSPSRLEQLPTPTVGPSVPVSVAVSSPAPSALPVPREARSTASPSAAKESIPPSPSLRAVNPVQPRKTPSASAPAAPEMTTTPASSGAALPLKTPAGGLAEKPPF